MIQRHLTAFTETENTFEFEVTVPATKTLDSATLRVKTLRTDLNADALCEIEGVIVDAGATGKGIVTFTLEAADLEGLSGSYWYESEATLEVEAPEIAAPFPINRGRGRFIVE